MYKNIREKLSTHLAKRIADTGMPWSQARQELRLRNPSLKPSDMPSDDQIETALREHYAVFDPEGHAKRLKELRMIAVDIMKELSDFKPEIFRGVLNGCADRYSPICLIVTGNPKDIEIFLLDKGFEPEVLFTPQASPNAPDEEIIFAMDLPEKYHSLVWPPMAMVKLSIYEKPNSIKKKGRKAPDPWQIPEETLRSANLDQFKKLIEKVELSKESQLSTSTKRPKKT